MKIPELGIGIIYFSGFRKVIESNFDLINVIEIEPQTFWLKKDSKLGSILFNEAEMVYLKNLDKPKIFHGVGYPVGSSLPIDDAHIPYLKKMIRALKPVWLSEHLSFNNIEFGDSIYNTNFLLPPLQTEEGIKVVSQSIKEYSSHFDIPFAFETGVNYLSKYAFEIEDGQFINEVAHHADSYILLDIHNLLVNQKNGRQSVKEFINQIDLENVLQIHLAGGFEHDGYYLDAHSNVSSEEVIELFEWIVKRLPNLKAVTFEMLPEYLNYVSDKAICKQLEVMNAIWDTRGQRKHIKKPKPSNKFNNGIIEFSPTVTAWEITLGCLAIGKHHSMTDEKLKTLLSNDKGLEIIQGLIRKFRSSLIVSSMKLSCRYIMLKYSLEKLDVIFEDYWLNSKPQLFALENGIEFANYMIDKLDNLDSDNILKELMIYELNSLHTLIDNQSREVEISFNILELIDALSAGELPKNIPLGKYEIVIEPDELIKTESAKPVFHS